MSAEWNNYLAFGNAKSEKEALTLKYWGGRGLMEVPRVMLAIGN